MRANSRLIIARFGHTSVVLAQSKTVGDSRTLMSEVIQPNDANFLGKAFGGAVLAKIDLCAYATASRFAEMICATASFDRVDFLEPIEVGELVELEGFVSYVGRTSVEVTVDVHSQNLLTNVRRHTNTARVTMVALQDGRPTPVPKLKCESLEDKIRFLEGRLRRELRASQRADFDRLASGFKEMDEAQLDALLEKPTLLS